MDTAHIFSASHKLHIDPARLPGMLEAAGIGLFTGAWPGGEMACNAVCAGHFGLTPGAVTTFDALSARLLPDDRERMRQAVAQSLQAGQDGFLDCQLFPGSAQTCRINVTWRVRRDAQGETCGWDGITRDISATAQAQAERDAAWQEAELRAASLSRVYEREHRIAEALQRSLLIKPSLEELSCLEVEAVYQAAWDEALVGGDYYDVFALEDGKLALAVGDVSGKGLEAASRTAEIKFTLRAYLREYPHAAPAMERLNAFLCEARALERPLSSYFVCLTLAILSPISGRLEICSAGAEPAFLLRASGETVLLRGGGLPLGVAAKAEYKSLTLTQEVGDLLLIVTDGLTEARRGMEFLGEQGVADLVRRSLDAESLAQVGEAILAGAQTFADGPLHDDVCLLLARRTA